MTLSPDASSRALPSLGRGAARAVRVPLEPATASGLAGLARVVRDYAAEEVIIVPWPVAGPRPLVPGTGNEGGITEGRFSVWPESRRLLARNEAVGRAYTLGWFCDPPEAEDGGAASKRAPGPAEPDRTRLYVMEANYHPDGGQVWMPGAGRPFVALLAPPGDGVRPEDFRAFRLDGSFGIQILPGVWHQPPLAAWPVTLDDKQGAVHACVAVDFPAEFGCYLEVPLPEPPPGG